MYFSFTTFEQIIGKIVDNKNRYRDRDRRNGPFYIQEEPNNNYHCEPFNQQAKFIAVFLDHEFKKRHVFFMKGNGNVNNVKRAIDFLDKRLKKTNLEIDRLQDQLDNNPQLSTETIEKHFHTVKQDLSSIRKLESFLLSYDRSYVIRLEYPGEERDNVNTY